MKSSRAVFIFLMLIVSPNSTSLSCFGFHFGQDTAAVLGSPVVAKAMSAAVIFLDNSRS